MAVEDVSAAPLIKPVVRTPAAVRPRSRRRVGRIVVLLGLTSLFTDMASEMVTTVLPLYLVYIGGFSVLAFGVIDGIFNGALALVGLAGGFAGDRTQRHKEVAATGYGLSALCKLALAVVGTGVTSIGAIVLIDRLGKGIRTAPRDAMISLSTKRNRLGAAFGVHRALDTTGAMLGPLVAFGVLAVAPRAFNELFVISFCLALIGLGILLLLVEPRAEPNNALEPCPATKRNFKCLRCTCGDGAAAAPPSLRQTLELTRIPRFRALLIAGAALSLATVSDAFVFLALWQQVDLPAAVFPLLFAGVGVVFMLLAAPLGRLADRVGRGRVLIGGYVLLLAVYAVLLGPLGGWLLVASALGLLGAYYAATDGVLMALGSGIVPETIRGSGLALLKTATSVSRLFASILFGAAWALWGMNAAVIAFGVALLAATTLSARALART